MAKRGIRPYKDDGTLTTFVTKNIWLPVMSVNKSLSESIKKVEDYLGTIFNPSFVKSIYLCTNCAHIVNDLVSFYVKVKINERINKNVIFTLKNIKINISPLAFYKIANTDVVDLVEDGYYFASARYKAIMGLSDYKGSSYVGDLLKLHDLLNSWQSLTFCYEINEGLCRLTEPAPNEFDGCITDELGEVFTDYNEIGKIKPINVKFVGCQYNLVGTRYYAEGSRKDLVHCVLFAETDNEHDEYAIKVLRWFPRIKNKPTISECFFSLGYISREENEALHQFMVEKHNKVLFGHIEHRVITIDAGIKSLNETDYSFPVTLLDNI